MGAERSRTQALQRLTKVEILAGPAPWSVQRYAGLVAATAERLGADLLTRNRKHFPMFPDLREPYAAA